MESGLPMMLVASVLFTGSDVSQIWRRVVSLCMCGLRPLPAKAVPGDLTQKEKAHLLPKLKVRLLAVLNDVRIGKHGKKNKIEQQTTGKTSTIYQCTVGTTRWKRSWSVTVCKDAHSEEMNQIIRISTDSGWHLRLDAEYQRSAMPSD